MSLFHGKKEPTSLVLHKLVKHIECRITYTTIKNKLLQHPNFPYLFSITNTLTNLGILNKPARIKVEQLEQLDTPFLATTFLEETLLVKKVDQDQIKYFSVSQGWKTLNTDSFKSSWNNMVILIDTQTFVEEQDYHKKRILECLRQTRLPLALAISLALIISLVVIIADYMVLSYFAFKTLGLMISLLLVNIAINKNTKYSFCQVGTKLSCDDVLNSPAAKIFSWLSMTDLGLLYFTGTVLALIISVIVPVATSTIMLKLLIITSFLSVPYTLFSLGYQALVIKKWCILCCATIVVLWVESVIGYLFLSESFFDLAIESQGVVIFAFCLTLPAIAWVFLKNTLKKSIGYNFLHFANLRVINNFKVFQFMQEKQKKIDMDFQPNEITIGETSALNTLVIAINPFCQACGKEYKSVLKLLKNHPANAKIVFRFVGGFNENNKRKLSTSAMLISHYLKNPLIFPQLLEKWFEHRDLRSFVEQHPIPHNAMAESILNHHFSWSNKSNISITPTTYFNGSQFSENYTLEQYVDILAMNIT